MRLTFWKLETIKDVVTATQCPGQQQVRNESTHPAKPPLKTNCTTKPIAVLMAVTTQIFLCATVAIKKSLSIFCNTRTLSVSKKNENGSSMEASGEKQNNEPVNATATNASFLFSLNDGV